MTTPTPLSELKRLGAAVERKQITMADAAAELLAFYGGEGLNVTLAGVERSLKNWRTDGVDPREYRRAATPGLRPEGVR